MRFVRFFCSSVGRFCGGVLFFSPLSLFFSLLLFPEAASLEDLKLPWCLTRGALRDCVFQQISWDAAPRFVALIRDEALFILSTDRKEKGQCCSAFCVSSQ